MEIEYWTNRYGMTNIAFYDDALLIDPYNHFIPIMKEVVKRGIRCNFHAPNALHIKEIDEEVAHFLFRSGFKTIRLGFESSIEKIQVETGGKVDNKDFQRSIKNLKRAGYPGEEIGVYIMAGLPGQRVGEVEEIIACVKESGARPMLVEYSPFLIPQCLKKQRGCLLLILKMNRCFRTIPFFPANGKGLRWRIIKD
jgi:radical SAM superfamily enzyme YgiQ (UPF0313 family)